MRSYINRTGRSGRSQELSNKSHSGIEQAALYPEIIDSLGIEDAYIAGAYDGWFILSNIGLYAPECVKNWRRLDR